MCVLMHMCTCTHVRDMHGSFQPQTPRARAPGRKTRCGLARNQAAPMSIVASLRERLLALGTGGFAGIVVSYYASRDIWQHAHDHGVLIDSTIDELRDLQGYERPSPPQARAPLKSSGGVAPLVRAQLGPRWRPTVFVPGAQAAPLASPFEVQLRLDLATAWNTRVRGLYDFMRRWAC